MNANFLANVDGERFVVRVYSTDASTADRECDLLMFLASTAVAVPRVLARCEVDERPVAILEFIDRTLSTLLTRPDRLSLDLNRRFQRLIRDQWGLVSDTEPRRQLVHSDFNPKNLMISVRVHAQHLSKGTHRSTASCRRGGSTWRS